MGTNRWTAALLLVLTFLLGIGVGFFARGPIFFGLRGRGMEERMRGRLTHRFAEELKLTPNQQAQVDQILEKNRRTMTVLRREVIRPRFEAIMDSTRMEIEAILTTEQKTQFKAFTQKTKAGHQRNQWLPWRGP